MTWLRRIAEAFGLDGVAGVVWHPAIGKWQARIKNKNRQSSLGYYFREKDVSRLNLLVKPFFGGDKAFLCLS
jgi:hypothetical protein